MSKNNCMLAGTVNRVLIQDNFIAFTLKTKGRTAFVPVVINGKAVDRLREKIQDGMACVVEGRFEPKNDKTGTTRYQVNAYSVELMDGGEMNHIVVSGRLTRDPEVRTTSKGNPVATGTIAVDRNYRDRNGEWQTITSFVVVNAWGELSEKLAGFPKGSLIWVTGSLASRKYTDKDGKDHYPVEVVAENIFDGGTGKRNVMAEEASTGNTTDPSAAPAADAAVEQYEEIYEEDEELPF